jgi:glycerol-3-phosphate dehydrogenase
VKGSHIVLPRLYEGEHAFILQNDDRRVVFMIPFEAGTTLVGTTDVPFEGDPATATASEDEVAYLCRAVNRYLARPVAPADVLWRYAGVRPLYDDGKTDPSAVTRDYTLRVDDEGGQAPVVSVFGGKITTYRRLAEQVLARLAPYFRRLQAPWTARACLPGSDFGGATPEQFLAHLRARYSHVEEAVLRSVFRRHGALTAEVLGEGDLGEAYGAGLYEREVRYLMEREWAHGADDILWRRTKAGLRMTPGERERFAARLGR